MHDLKGNKRDNRNYINSFGSKYNNFTDPCRDFYFNANWK